jgi:hypothetical protein
MLSPWMYSRSRFLHRSMRIFHCWKQCCRSYLDFISFLDRFCILVTFTRFFWCRMWDLERNHCTRQSHETWHCSMYVFHCFLLYVRAIYNMWHKLHATSLKDAFVIARNIPSRPGRNSPRCKGFLITPRFKAKGIFNAETLYRPHSTANEISIRKYRLYCKLCLIWEGTFIHEDQKHHKSLAFLSLSAGNLTWQVKTSKQDLAHTQGNCDCRTRCLPCKQRST